MEREIPRPIISEYDEPTGYFVDMIEYRKLTEPGFSVFRAAKTLRRVSPTLVSLISQGKRRITIDRLEEFAKLLQLSASEKFYFKNWLENRDRPDIIEEQSSVTKPERKRRQVGTSILTDWVNVYVKDFFQLEEVQKNPNILFEMMAHVATHSRIQKSLQFLLREGHLRKTLDGRVVLETELAVGESPVPSEKIRAFHKGALKLAQLAVDLFSPQERLANALVIPLNEKSYGELMELVEEFAEKLKVFAEENSGEGDRLYQLLLNVSPVGGKKK